MKLAVIIFLTFATFTGLLLNKSEVSAKESTEFAKCGIPPFDVEFAQAKAIFAGKVISVRTEGDEKIFKFRVEKYWKSTMGKTVEVRYYENMRYQAWLEVGGHYLVYAKGKNTKKLKHNY